MSGHRSSSGVRTLAAMFENHEATSADAGGRSPNGRLSVNEGDRALSKVRSSFVAVDEPNNAIDIDPEESKAAAEERHSTASLRRASMSLDETENKDALQEVKDTVEEEKEARRKSAVVPETIPESAVAATPATATPAVEAKDYMAAGALAAAKTQDKEVEDTGSKLKAMTLPDDDTPVANPDKPVTSAEEEPGTMQAGDPMDAAATTVDNDAPKVASPEKASKSAAQPSASTPKKSTSNFTKPSTPASARRGTPSKIQTSTSKPSSTPASKPTKAVSPMAVKTPSSASRPTTSDSKAGVPGNISSPSSKRDVRPPRASLTAPTAASAAKAKSSAQDGTDNHDAPKHPPTKAQPKTSTRPAKVPSHLLAPTASSAAKHEANKADHTKPVSRPAAMAKSSAPASRSFRSSTSGTKPPSTSARSSLARNDVTSTKSGPRSSMTKTGVADEGFLARMTRATASSAGKTHDKAEIKESPKRRPSVIKPRGNATGKASRAAKVERSGAGSGPTNANGTAMKPTQTSSPAVSMQEATDATNANSANDVSQSTPAKEPEVSDSSLADTPAFESATIR